MLVPDERGLGRVLSCLEGGSGGLGQGGSGYTEREQAQERERGREEREAIGNLVRSIRFGGGRWMTSFDFEKLLNLCTNVEEVWIDGLGIRTSWLMAAPCQFSLFFLTLF